jgi:hypothetical protein
MAIHEGGFIEIRPSENYVLITETYGFGDSGKIGLIFLRSCFPSELSNVSYEMDWKEEER